MLLQHKTVPIISISDTVGYKWILSQIFITSSALFVVVFSLFLELKPNIFSAVDVEEIVWLSIKGRLSN
jgi:hypothetical protein